MAKPGNDDRYHVYPLNDLREHIIEGECWCGAYDDDGVIIHNALDGREKFETGERKRS